MDPDQMAADINLQYFPKSGHVQIQESGWLGVQTPHEKAQSYRRPRNAVDHVSDCRYVSDCRSSDHKFDLGPAQYFRGD